MSSSLELSIQARIAEPLVAVNDDGAAGTDPVKKMLAVLLKLDEPWTFQAYTRYQ
jgi:hypothetical protein